MKTTKRDLQIYEHNYRDSLVHSRNLETGIFQLGATGFKKKNRFSRQMTDILFKDVRKFG